MAGNVQDITARLGEVIGGSKVFGEPIQQDGTTVIPVFRVSGGGGGGGNVESEETGKRGFGGGLRFTSRPVGVYVLREGQVSWRPSVDVNHIVLTGVAGVIGVLLAVRSLIKGVAQR